MSKLRHQKIRSLSAKFSPGHRIDWHSHDWAQLVYASEGVISVDSEHKHWLVPPRRAIWVPAKQRHCVEMHGNVHMQTIYFNYELHQIEQCECKVVAIPPLLHELIVHICDLNVVGSDTLENRNLIQFFEFQFEKLVELPCVVAMPQDDRAQQLATKIITAPGSTISLAELSRECRTSLRTMQRVFRNEVGMPLAQWKSQVKMLRAAQLLIARQSVTDVAFELGFSSVSGFVQAFKKFYGETPGRYRGK